MPFAIKLQLHKISVNSPHPLPFRLAVAREWCVNERLSQLIVRWEEVIGQHLMSYGGEGRGGMGWKLAVWPLRY
jgi:hypothetical protein